MSIRRKTCETTALLYEAALKTNLSDQQDRPSNVNPTAGVRMREQFGNSVFIPDTTKPGGGIWVAGSRDEMMNSGLPQGDQVLRADYPAGARGSLDQRALARGGGTGFGSGSAAGTGTGTGTGSGSGVITPNRPELNNDQDAMQNMQNTTNVNPNINDVGIPFGPSIPGSGGGQPLAGQDVSLNHLFLLFSSKIKSGRIEEWLTGSCSWILEIQADSMRVCWRVYH